MKHKYLLDLNDESNWLYTSGVRAPSGEMAEDMRVFIMPDMSGNRFYTMTDSAEHPIDYLMPFHQHHKGYETFFVDSGAMQLHIHGQQCRVEKGSVLHFQPFETHGMSFYEEVKYRGFFQGWNGIDYIPEMNLLEQYYPGVRARLAESGVMSGRDHHEVAYCEYEHVPVEDVRAVRRPERPLAKFVLDGVVAKMMVARWELGGLREVWRFEMEEGFHAESVDFPAFRQLYYVTGGEVLFKVCEDEFVAGPECMVDVPRLLPHSIKAKSNAVMYDVGGMSCWYNFLHDYTAAMKHAPEKLSDKEYIAGLKKRDNIHVRSFGF